MLPINNSFSSMYSEHWRSFLLEQTNKSSLRSTVPSYMRKVLVRHAMLTGTSKGDPDNDLIVHDIVLLGEHILTVVVADFLHLSNRPKYTAMVADVLTEMRVPDFEQPFVIDQIFTGVKQADHPKWPIACFILDTTVFYESIYDRLKDYQSEAFEEVKIDCLEDGDRRKECVFCMESLDYFEGVEEGADHVQLMIVRLSCSHLFHQDCIFPWLVSSPLCPVCQYSLPKANPIVKQDMKEVPEPSRPSWQQLHWPMLLTVSAGGLLAALLVCRLKQRQV